MFGYLPSIIHLWGPQLYTNYLKRSIQTSFQVNFCVFNPVQEAPPFLRSVDTHPVTAARYHEWCVLLGLAMWGPGDAPSASPTFPRAVFSFQRRPHGAGSAGACGRCRPATGQARAAAASFVYVMYLRCSSAA